MYEGLVDQESLRAEDGVKCFKDTLKPHFTEGAQSVSRWRCLGGLFLPVSSTTEQKTAHEKSFPSSDNLTALMFTVACDLSETKRERLTSFLSLQGVNVAAYTFAAIWTVFVELYCTPKSSTRKTFFSELRDTAATWTVGHRQSNWRTRLR